MAEALGQQIVEFSVLVRNSSEAALSSLKELFEISPELSDTERKIGLLKYVLKTRQRLLRLLSLSKWCRQIPLVERCQQLAGTVSNHDMSFTQAADFLFYLHDTLQQARAPVYDIPTAAEILVTGSYKRLPKCIEDLGMHPVLTGEEKEVALKKLDILLRCRLLDILLPKQISNIKVTGGRVILRVAGEFEAHLTLGYRGNLSLWRVLKLDILVGESTGPIQVTDPQRYFLGDELERRMAASDDPVGLLYSILHQFCTALVMDTLFRQVKVLQGGRWRDAIKYEKLSETYSSAALSMSQVVAGQSSGPTGDVDGESGGTAKIKGAPGLKIVYWLETKGETSPSLRIELGADQQITCSHFPSVLDPFTKNEAEFEILTSCVSVEKLLLRAIACNVHTRLLEIQRGLKGGIQLWQSDSDVILRQAMPAEPGISSEVRSEDGNDDEAGEEVLCIRAFGISYMALGISIRNGRFFLRCPSTLLASPALEEMEDALNHATRQPLDVFVNLRTKCLLHYFGLIGRSLNLKLYERGAITVKLPLDGPKLGADVLIMGFPQCGDSFFLCLQLDPNFMPLFTLLEAQPQSSPCWTTLMSSSFNIFRWMKVDIETMLLLREDASFSLLDEGDPDDKGFSARMVLNMMEHEGGGKCDTRALPRGFSGAVSGSSTGLEISQTGLDQYNWEDKGGIKSPCVYSHKGNNLVAHFSSNLIAGGSPLQHGNVFYGMNGASHVSNHSLPPSGYHQGKPLGGGSAHGEAISRVGRRGFMNGAATHNVLSGSPLRNPIGLRNQITHHISPAPIRSPLQGNGDQEVLNTKSPLALGDNAASPIDLDDEDLSKLIDSISSKTSVSGLSGSFTLTDPSNSSLQMRPVQQRISGMPRSATGQSNSRYALGKGTPSPVSQLGHASEPLRTNSPGWKSILPASVSFSTETSPVSQERTDLEHSGRVGMLHMQDVLCKLSIGTSKRKQSTADLFCALPSLKAISANTCTEKKRKLVESVPVSTCQPKPLMPSPTYRAVLESFTTQTYGNVIRAANQGKASAGAYRAVFLEVDRRCRLCIKHARLTRQMDAQGIPYVNEVGLREPSTVLRFRLPATVPTGDPRTKEIWSDESFGWQQMCLCLGSPGTEGWKVEVTDSYFNSLWELQRQHEGLPCMRDVQFASPSQDDAHMQCTHEGLVLKYPVVEADSVLKLVTDLERIWRARSFAISIKKILGIRDEGKKQGREQWNKAQGNVGQIGDKSERGEKRCEVMRQAFRVEAVGLTTVSFTYVGSSLLPGVVARFVVEWGSSHRGCAVHSPEQLWPHTKFLEDYINGGEVELLLDTIQVTAGPLHALAAAIRPARMAIPTASSLNRPQSPSAGPTLASKSPGSLLTSYTTSTGGTPSAGQGRGMNSGSSTAAINSIGAQVPPQAGAMASNTARSPGPGLVPSSLLPTDVSVLLRSAYWVRIVYRQEFAIDMRCFAGDQVWLQPAPPPHCGGKVSGGSLPCPQFRTFVVEHVTLGMNTAESVGGGFAMAVGSAVSNSVNTAATNSARLSNQGGSLLIRAGNTMGSGPGIAHAGLPTSGTMVSPGTGRSAVTSSSLGSSLGLRGELNPALVGMGDDGGYGGAWVPLAALKKVLRATLRYLGGLWLFAQFPSILKEVLVLTMRENEGALLNHDPEQPALRFFIRYFLSDGLSLSELLQSEQMCTQCRGCVFAVSMHRQQLFLQAINVKRYQQQQALSAGHQQAVPGQATNFALELSAQETSEIGDFFVRRVASEPYDASRLASFVTMLTLPVPVLREFLGLIQWKKDASKANGVSHGAVGDALAQGQSPRPRVELSLETPVGSAGREPGVGQQDETGGFTGRSQTRSSIHHNQPRYSVEFTLTFSFDASQIPHLNVAGGAGWLPQSVALRLAYLYSDGSNRINLLNMDGSHGGHSCWACSDDWERCKERVAQAVKTATADGHGCLHSMAEAVQVALQTALVQIGTGAL